jgi:hypothetical protein
MQGFRRLGMVTGRLTPSSRSIPCFGRQIDRSGCVGVVSMHVYATSIASLEKLLRFGLEHGAVLPPVAGSICKMWCLCRCVCRR